MERLPVRGDSSPITGDGEISSRTGRILQHRPLRPDIFPFGKMTDTPDATTFGARVRAAREKLGLRQEDVALASGVGVRFVGDLERGKTTVELDRALRVAAAVGLDVRLDDRA